MITEERLKYYSKEINVTTGLLCQFLMTKSGNITSLASTGLTTIQYAINGGTVATPSFPIAYNANDVVSFVFSYTNQITATGNLIIFGKDN